MDLSTPSAIARYVTYLDRRIDDRLAKANDRCAAPSVRERALTTADRFARIKLRLVREKTGF